MFLMTKGGVATAGGSTVAVTAAIALIVASFSGTPATDNAPATDNRAGSNVGGPGNPPAGPKINATYADLIDALNKLSGDDAKPTAKDLERVFSGNVAFVKNLLKPSSAQDLRDYIKLQRKNLELLQKAMKKENQPLDKPGSFRVENGPIVIDRTDDGLKIRLPWE